MPNFKTPKDLVDYTSQLWRDLDQFYQFHVERWKQTLDFIRLSTGTPLRFSTRPT